MPDPQKTEKPEDEQRPDDAANEDLPSNEVASDVPPLELNETAVPDDGAKKDDLVPDLVPESDAQPQSDDDATPFDDEKTEQAINEIVAKEGDELLAVQD